MLHCANDLFMYHPTTIIFIDDDASFAKALSCEIQSEQYHVEYYDHVRLAQERLALDASNPISLSKDQLLKYVYEEELSDPAKDGVEVSFKFAFDKIHERVYDPDRFRKISSVIVDYAMPELTGVDFCLSISKDSVAQKIMLTGQASADIAIDAFNDQVIDKFVTKGAVSSLPSKLKREISRYLTEFFCKSTHAENALMRDYMPSFYFTNQYKELFELALSQSKAIEYYLLDKNGSYIFLDRFGNAQILAIFPEDNIDMYRDLAQQYELSNDIIAKMEKGYLPFLYRDIDFEKAPSDWVNNLVETKAINGCKARYAYFSEVNIKSGPILERNKICSYDDFLKSTMKMDAISE